VNKYLPILILAIFADVIGNNSVIRVFEVQNHFGTLMLTISMLILQMFTAPLQAGFSDYYYRKKSLIFALACSLISLLLLAFAKSVGMVSVIALWLGLFINSCFGNIVPIAWSALADMQKKNLRFFLGLTTSAYAIGYIVLALMSKAAEKEASQSSWILEDVVLPLIVIGFSIIFVWKAYYDRKNRSFTSKFQDEKPTFVQIARSEINSLLKEIQNPTTCFGLLAYLCWAASQYSLLLLLLNSQKYTVTVIVMMIGYLVGVSILGLCRKIQDEKIIKTAYVITISFMLMFFIFNLFKGDSNHWLTISCFFYTLGNAFLTPSIFSLFSKEREIHEQGKGFGLIVSADSAGFLIGIITVGLFEKFKIDIIYMVLFSFILFLASIFPYFSYEKTRKDVEKILNNK